MMSPAYTTTATLTQICRPIQSIFPERKGDVPFWYHKPRSSSFNPHAVAVSRIVLSITPTPGFYSAVSTAQTQTPTPLAFLHRPWGLDRRRLPRGATVIASHKGFDEVLTVGNNVALASRLGMDIARSAVIQGYKGDAERTIGIVGPIGAISSAALRQQIEAEFGQSAEDTNSFGFDEDVACPAKADINTIAIMNAFQPTEVERVETKALELGLISSSASTGCGRILYLTGAVRELGLAAALNKGMAVVCVGHRTCEEWGIRHLARTLREAWPFVEVDTILEDENANVAFGGNIDQRKTNEDDGTLG